MTTHDAGGSHWPARQAEGRPLGPAAGNLTRRQALAGVAAGAAGTVALGGMTPAHAAAGRDHGDRHPGDTRHHGETALPSGRQYVIEHGDQRAVITEEGAGLRSYQVHGREFLDTFDPSGYATGDTRGQLLLPFPNRVDHGRYTFRDTQYQLPVNEVPRSNAIHGLTRWMNWHVAHHDHHRLTMELVLHAQPGYPFVLHVREHFELTDDGLAVTDEACNVGTQAAPYGTGMHPYLTVGTDAIDSTTLRLPANSYVPQNDRLIPKPPAETVKGTPYDFREPRRIGDTFMDRGFTDLIRDADGLARMWLEHPSGSPRITMWLDETRTWMWFYTGEEPNRTGLATEPYTCCSDAFNNGLDLRALEPGETSRSTWGLTVDMDSVQR